MRDRTMGDAEFWVLSTAQGRSLLSEVASISSPGPSELARWSSGTSQEIVSAAIRIAEGQRRGMAKFSLAGQMWFDRIGLEQSTTELVARHKASRFAGRTRTVIDLCCGIGGDTLALASRAEVLAVDMDETMCRRTRWNAEVYQFGEQVAPVCARAESIAIPRGAWVHIDPDRRLRSASRAKRLVDYEPGLAFLHSLADRVEGGAIKVSPASDFDQQFPRERFEVELVSLGGECKEATVWFGTAASCGRRATRLPEGVTWTDRESAINQGVEVSPVLRYVFDPDPSLARSGLLDGFASKHSLTRYVAGIDYLTGPSLVKSAFLVPFEVLAELPLDMRRIKAEIASREIGVLEVKMKGLDLKPEEIRAKLRGREGMPATLLLSGGHGKARAVIARRV